MPRRLPDPGGLPTADTWARPPHSASRYRGRSVARSRGEYHLPKVSGEGRLRADSCLVPIPFGIGRPDGAAALETNRLNPTRKQWVIWGKSFILSEALCLFHKRDTAFSPQFRGLEDDVKGVQRSSHPLPAGISSSFFHV